VKIYLPVATIAITALLGCSDAKKSNEVVEEYIPASMYSDYSCKGLRVEAERIVASIPQMEASLDSEYRKDKTAEVAAWILFWPAALAMDGNTGEQRSYAISKGRLEAIYANLKSKGC
jgi:hypothetical protein